MKYLILLAFLGCSSEYGKLTYNCKESSRVEKEEIKCNDSEEMCTQYKILETKCQDIDLNIMGI